MNDAVFITLLLIFVRIGAVVMVMPVVSTQGVPRHVPIFLTLLLTVLIGPHAPISTVSTLGGLLLAVGAEVALGLVAGTLLSAVFSSLSLASEIISQQTGFAMMTLFNPIMKTSEGPLGVLAGLLAGVSFLAAGLHLKVLVILSDSFEAIPPGAASVSDVLANDVIAMVGVSIALGVQLAGPVIVLVLLINLFVGMLTRLAPKMNVFFSVGMSATGTAGILVFAAALPWMLVVHAEAMDAAVRMFAGALGFP